MERPTKDFFKNAYEKISAETVSILRISDFKTKGLTGSKDTNDINTDWMRLTKSSGSSDKKGPAGGSFGIGKFAPFACSDFSTVFYNTYDIETVDGSVIPEGARVFEKNTKVLVEGNDEFSHHTERLDIVTLIRKYYSSVIYPLPLFIFF